MSDNTFGNKKRDLFAFDRADRAVLLVILGLTILGTALTALALPVLRWIQGDAIPVGYSADVPLPALERAGIEHHTVETVADVPGTGVAHAVSIAPGALLTVVVAMGALLLAGLVRDVGSGQPFASRNVRRLRTLAGMLIAGAVLVPMIASLCDAFVIRQADLDGVLRPDGWGFTVSLVPLITGFLVALIAEAFAVGSRMSDDLEGVI